MLKFSKKKSLVFVFLLIMLRVCGGFFLLKSMIMWVMILKLIIKILILIL